MRFGEYFAKKIVKKIVKIFICILPKFLVNCAIWCVLEYIFCELSLKKIYKNLNNIDMLLLMYSYHGCPQRGGGENRRSPPTPNGKLSIFFAIWVAF